MKDYDFKKYIGKDKCEKKCGEECDCVICSYEKLYDIWRSTSISFDAIASKEIDLGQNISFIIGAKAPIINDMLRTNHLRFNFDARNDIEERFKNNEIIELFRDEIGDKRAIIHTHKGTVWCFT